MATASTNDDEEITVLFHAALLGRTDVLQRVISNVKSRSSIANEDDLAKFISVGRSDDGCTALHVASAFGHQDIVRALLVSVILGSIIFLSILICQSSISVQILRSKLYLEIIKAKHHMKCQLITSKRLITFICLSKLH